MATHKTPPPAATPTGASPPGPPGTTWAGRWTPATSSAGRRPPPPPPVVTKDPVYDFSGSGKSDILWRNSSTGQNVLWLMNGATVASAPALATVADLNWTIAGARDFNGDGKADILWRNKSTGL